MVRTRFICTFALLAVVPMAEQAAAQILQRAIGGVLIDPQGALQPAGPSISAARAAALRNAIPQPAAAWREPQAWRSISLRQLEAELLRLSTARQPVPDELQFLGGLSQVQAILVDPGRDIWLAGPSEAWTIHPSGEIVGVDSGRPILLLDDLMVAFRSVESSRERSISCSIDPTAEGRRALDRFLARVKRFDRRVLPQMEQVLGAQEITITGVPTDTHFAAVLAAADFQMKRYAMQLQPAPIADFPSYLQLVQQRSSIPRHAMPRWWLAVEYTPPACSTDHLTWELHASRVSAMTEDERILADGSVQGTGRTHPVAKQWADQMTQRYAELAQADMVLAQLHQLMDLAMVAAIIHHHDLRGLADCPLTGLFDAASPIATDVWDAPRSVASQASFIQVGRQTVVTASGGVAIDPWPVASRPQVDPALKAVTDHAVGQPAPWCADRESVFTR